MTTTSNADVDLTILSRIADNAALEPNRIAVTSSTQKLSYEELQRAIERIGNAIFKAGVLPGSRVGIWINRNSCMAVAAMLGALRAGVAFVPFDTRHPISRAQIMAERVDIRAMLVNQEKPDMAGLVFLDVAEAPTETLPSRTALASSEAYVLFTSGSTGTPNAVSVSLGGLDAYLSWAAATYTSEQSINSIVASSIAFDLTITGLFLPLLAGGNVNLVRENADIAELGSLLCAIESPVLLKMTPLHAQLLSATLADAVDVAVTFVLGGEALSYETVLRIRAAFPRCRIFNEYGPTETVVGCAVFEVDNRVAGSVPIGFAARHAELRVLRAGGTEICPPGEVGELFIGGDSVAAGYVGNPQLTALRFIPDVCGLGRLYRTGDLVVTDDEGLLTFIGRHDGQVKVRGYRVEPAEVESAIKACPGVLWAAVLPIQVAEQTVLVAVVRMLDVSMDTVKKFVASRLPEYMFPFEWRLVDREPLTVNGKLDRTALRDMFLPASEAPAGNDDPVLEVMRNHLGFQLGPNDDFFAAGGSSLVGMLIVNDLRRRGIRLTLESVFAGRTACGISALIESIASTAHRIGWPGAFELTTGHGESERRATIAQEQIWLLHQLFPENRAYNANIAIHIAGELDVAKLRSSAQWLIDKHDSLRTSFEYESGSLLRTVARTADVRFREVNLAEGDGVSLEALKEEVLNTRFEFGRPPLIEWTLVHLATNKHILFQVEHHFVHDGWSMALILRDLATAYRLLLTTGKLPSSDVEYDMSDFVAWQRTWLDTETANDQLLFWKQLVSEAPAASTFPSQKMPVAPRFIGAARRWRADGFRTTWLRERAAEMAVSPFALALAAFALLLSRESGHDEVLFATSFANRRVLGTENLVGMLVNAVPISIKPDSADSVTSYVQKVARTITKLFEQQEMPFERIVRAVNPRRTNGISPLFRVAFSFHDAPAPFALLNELNWQVEYLHNGSAKADVNVVIISHGERGLEGIWEYDSDRYSSDEIDQWMSAFDRTLDALSIHRSANIKSLDAFLRPRSALTRA